MGENRLLLPYLYIAQCILYIDRGIIPGANKEFSDFVLHTVKDCKSPNFYIGLLQSVFIVGLCTAPIFAQLTHVFAQRTLLLSGIIIWQAAVCASAIAGPVKSYILLIIGRGISGVGEASFICITPVLLMDIVPSASLGKAMGVFYAMIPLGTAIGFGYGSLIASTYYGWPLAFGIEVIIGIPLLLGAFILIPKRDPDALIERVISGGDPLLTCPLIKKELEPVTSEAGLSTKTTTRVSPLSDITDSNDNPKSIMKDLLDILRSSTFRYTAFAMACYTAALSGMTTFGSSFMINLGFTDSERISSMTVGGIAASSGLLGTLIGGWIIRPNLQTENDIITKRRLSRELEIEEMSLVQKCLKMKTILECVFPWSVAGILLLLITVFATNYYLFCATLMLGLLLIFTTQAGLSIVAMLSVGHNNRALVNATLTWLLHLFGDVPSPIIIGYLKDYMAPHCVLTDVDPKTHLIIPNEACLAEGRGIRFVIFVIVVWLGGLVLGIWQAGRSTTRSIITI